MDCDVLYVLRYWPERTETFVREEVRELARRGARITVITMGARDPVDDVPAETLAVPRGRALLRAWARRPARSKWLARVRWAVEQGRERRVQRVHAHFAGEAAFFAREVARQLGVPFSVTVHAVDLFVPLPGVSRLIRDASPCITICEHHRDWIAHRHGVSSAIVRCGIRLAGRPVAVPEREPAAVVCIARDVPKKGLWRLPDDVIHTGVAPQSVPARLARAQVFALPCQVANNGDRDGVPVVIMEAMAAGLPIVTRPIAGIPELVDPSVGWIAHDFEGSLADALSDPFERADRGRMALERARERCGIEGSVDALCAAWARLTP